MERTYKFEVGPVVEQLDRILQMELASVVYYTHYSFMATVTRESQSPPGCEITQANRLRMLKRRER